MRQFLLNLADVLSDLEQLAADIDTSVGELLAAKINPQTPDYSMLQKVDLLYQSLAAIRQVTANAHGLSCDAADLDPAQLVEGVLLETIRKKCTAIACSSEPQQPMDDLIF